MPPATAHCTLAVGKMLNWYRIDAVLGRGGFGVIYRATDTNLDHPVAIKEYVPGESAERDGDTTVRPASAEHADQYRQGLQRFIKEARNLVRFKHPNIVRVMSVFQQNNTAYMVMEFEAGVELGRYLTQPGARDEARLKALIGPVCEGLLEVHRHGFIHRDIKPANILVRPDGSPVLLDFGSARDASLKQGRGMTALVTVGYAPLEQYDDAEHEQQGPWTDVYALGGVLYHAISGNEPIDSARRGSALLNGGRDPLIAAATIGRGRYGARFLAAIDWALEFRIADRPQSVRDWLPALLGQSDPVVRTLPAPEVVRSEQEGADSEGEPTRLAPRVPGEAFRNPTSRRHAPPSRRATAEGAPSSAAGPDAPGARSRSTRPVRHGDRTTGSVVRRPSGPDVERGLAGRSVPRDWRRVLPTSVLGVALAASGGWWLMRDGAPPDPPARAEATGTDADTLASQRERSADLDRRERAFDERQALARREAERALATRKARLEAERQEAERAEREAELRRAARLRAAEAERSRALASASRRFTSALDAADQALDERRPGAAREALEQAAASGFSGQRLGEVSDRLEAVLAEMRRPVSDAEFDEVVGRFDRLKRGIEDKDLATVDALTEPSEQNGLFAQLSERFEALNMEITGIRVRNADKSVSANLRIRDMLRENGDLAVPSEAFRDREITSRLVDGEWSPIVW